MARSLPTECPPLGWLTNEEFHSERRGLGSHASQNQLERWRETKNGLLPATFRKSPSPAWHHPAAPRQTVAIERALDTKNDLEFARTAVWLAGFDIDARFWRDQIEAAGRDFIHARGKMLRAFKAFERRNPSNSFGEELTSIFDATDIFGNILRRVKLEGMSRIFDLITDIMNKQFTSFHSEADASSSFGLFLNAFGLVVADKEKEDRRSDIEKGFKPEKALEDIFSAIALWITHIETRTNSCQEILEARNDVCKILKLAFCFYQATSPIYGQKAFGLRFAGALSRLIPDEALFLLIEGFAQVRKSGANLYSSSEIAQMADRSEAIWLATCHLREICQEKPEFEHLIGWKRLRLALSNPSEGANYAKELEGCGFLRQGVRPWDTWQKQLTKTTHIGLLAMSIGSPEHISSEKLLAAVSGQRHR